LIHHAVTGQDPDPSCACIHHIPFTYCALLYLIVKEVTSSETLLYFYQTTGHHIPEDSNFKKEKIHLYSRLLASEILNM
jgi:hypothetical protein